MMKRQRGVWFSGVVMAAALLFAARPSPAQDGFGAVLTGNGGALCGPCRPMPVLTHAAPGSPVIALRYRWSAEARSFQPISKEYVGVTDDQGELRFGLKQGESSLDKVVVRVGGALSEGVLFVTHGECAGPRLCPLPRRYYAMLNASRYLTGQAVVVTVSGATPGQVLEFAIEEYVPEGSSESWLPASKPFTAEVDAQGQATVIVDAPGPGVYRGIARDLATGEESGFSVLEVNDLR
jgi:hypothetical protein